jgi:hypothetical protein
MYFAPQYFAFGDRAFSQALIEQLKTWMAIDNIRGVLQVGEAVLLLLAALLPMASAAVPARNDQ